MTNPKVSVIVPVFNTEKYLKRCIDSLINQTLQELEIIMVDDGSKEDCAGLCDELSALDSRIKVIHKKNGGLGYARNTGLENATGEYVGFVDSDDYIEPEMYETLYNASVEYDSDLAISGFCFVGGNMFSEGDEITKKIYFDEYTEFKKEDMNNLLLGVIGALPNEPDDSRYGVSVCKNIFKASLIKEKNLKFMSEREILSEDTIFMIDFIKEAHSAIGIPEAYYCYVRNDGSLSKSYKSDRFIKSMIFLDELEKRIGNTIKKEEYKIYLDRLIQGFGRILCSQEIMHCKEEKIQYSVLRKKLSQICNHDKIKNALKAYPWYKLPVKQAAFAFAMKYRLYYLQKLMVLLRDR